MTAVTVGRRRSRPAPGNITRRDDETASSSQRSALTFAGSPGGGGGGERIDSLKRGRKVNVLSVDDGSEKNDDVLGRGDGSRRGRRRPRRRPFEVSVVRKIGEGGSSFVYLVKAAAERAAAPSDGERATASTALVVKPSTADGYGANSSPENAALTQASALASWRRKSLGRALILPGGKHSRRHNRPDCRYVVLKATNITGPDGGGGSDDRARRLRSAETEVAMLRRLSSHPNILGLIDAGWWVEGEGGDDGDDDDYEIDEGVDCTRKCYDGMMLTPTRRNLGVHCVLLEYCPGGSLMDLISRQRHIMLSCRGEGGGSRSNGAGHRGRYGESSDRSSSALRKLNCRRQSRKTFAAAANGIDFDGGGGGAIVPAEECYENGYIPLPVIVDVLRQISDALSFLHCCFEDGPVIHRDIKPENILLVPRPSRHSKHDNESRTADYAYYDVRLADFGSATVGRTSLRSARERTEATDAVLKSTTQMYRAPEMVDPHMAEELTERTDVWALGCTLYLTLYLRNCFEENSNLAILSGRYRIPRDDPYADTPGAEDLLGRMLSLDPSRRAGIAEVRECADALAEGRELPPRRLWREAGDEDARNGCAADGLDGVDRGVEVDDIWRLHSAAEASSAGTTKDNRSIVLVEGKSCSAVDTFEPDKERSSEKECEKQVEPLPPASQTSGEESREVRAGSRTPSAADRRRYKRRQQLEREEAEAAKRTEQHESLLITDDASDELAEATRWREGALAAQATGDSESDRSASSFQVDDIYRDLMADREEDGTTPDQEEDDPRPAADPEWFQASFFHADPAAPGLHAGEVETTLSSPESAPAAATKSPNSKRWYPPRLGARDSAFRPLSSDDAIDGDSDGDSDDDYNHEHGHGDDDDDGDDEPAEWLRSAEVDMTDDILRSIRIFPTSPFADFSLGQKAAAAMGGGGRGGGANSPHSAAYTDEGDGSCPGGIELSLAGTSTSTTSCAPPSTATKGEGAAKSWDEYGDRDDDRDDDHNEMDFAGLLEEVEEGTLGRARRGGRAYSDAGAAEYLKRVCPAIFSGMGEC